VGVGRSGESCGAQGRSAQGAGHAPQGDDGNKGAQRRSGKPLATAAFARSLRGGSGIEQNGKQIFSKAAGKYKGA